VAAATTTILRYRRGLCHDIAIQAVDVFCTVVITFSSVLHVNLISHDTFFFSENLHVCAYIINIYSSQVGFTGMCHCVVDMHAGCCLFKMSSGIHRTAVSN